MKNGHSLTKEGIAGASAGIAGTILGFPFDTIKTRMQTSHQSIAQTANTIFRENKFIGFYRGISSPLVALTILNMLNFSSYAKLCDILGVQNHTTYFDWRIAAAGAFAGPFASMISTPFELVKTQIQLNSRLENAQRIQFRGSLHATQYLFSNYGLKSLYRGHSVNTVREMVFLSTYFSVYESIKLFLISSMSSNPLSIPIAGGIAGAVGWFVSFPLDSIKSNLQGNSDYINGLKPQPSSFEIASRLMKDKGVFGLYRGVAPSIIRAFIVSGTRFSAYEFVHQLLKDID